MWLSPSVSPPSAVRANRASISSGMSNFGATFSTSCLRFFFVYPLMLAILGRGVPARRAGGGRQVEEDRRAGPAREDADCPTHALGQLAGDVQPETDAAHALPLVGIESVEALEDLRVRGGRYARPLVGDREANRGRHFVDPHDYCAVGILQGVVDETGEDLP